jgi:hypothetical protein
MIRWIGASPRLEGFFYYPVWEIAVGVFLMVSAIGLPALFLTFNGVQTKQYGEWIFCLVFFLFFGWMGKTLTFQSLTARFAGDRITIHHNLRDPELSWEAPLQQWTELKTAEAVDEQGRQMKTLLVLTADSAHEIYRSINPVEVDAIRQALEVMLKNKPQ